MAVECIAVSIAMYCLIQFYIQVKDDISQHRPFLKILSIKLVIFLSFWQGVSQRYGLHSYHRLTDSRLILSCRL